MPFVHASTGRLAHTQRRRAPVSPTSGTATTRSLMPMLSKPPRASTRDGIYPSLTDQVTVSSFSATIALVGVKCCLLKRTWGHIGVTSVRFLMTPYIYGGRIFTYYLTLLICSGVLTSKSICFSPRCKYNDATRRIPIGPQRSATQICQPVRQPCQAVTQFRCSHVPMRRRLQVMGHHSISTEYTKA